VHIKKKRVHVLIGHDRAQYSMTPAAIAQRRKSLNRGNGATEAERREAGKRAAAIRWGKA